MKVDEKGEHRLTNFHGTKGGKKTTYADHNTVTLHCQFLKGQTQPCRVELFNFKNVEGQHLFTTETTYTSKFSKCFEDNTPFIKQSQNWFKVLNDTFHKCFTKIRSRKRKHEVSYVEQLLEKRKKLRRETQKETDTDSEEKILEIEEEIGNITNWKDADNVWRRFEEVANSENAASTQAMWRWKKQIFPKIRPSPPMGVKDRQGRVKTKTNEIKAEYEREYSHRLRACPLLPELVDIENMQNQLFQKRLISASRMKTPP